MQTECEVVKVEMVKGKKVVKVRHSCNPTTLVTLTETEFGWQDEFGVSYPSDYIEV